jgi:hypothetical protein
VTPTTIEGLFTANLIMYVGVVSLALPIGVISSNFADVYAAHFKQIEERKLCDEGAIDDLSEAVECRITSKPPAGTSAANDRVLPLQETSADLDDDPLFIRPARLKYKTVGPSPLSVTRIVDKVHELDDLKLEWEAALEEIEMLLACYDG